MGLKGIIVIKKTPAFAGDCGEYRSRTDDLYAASVAL